MEGRSEGWVRMKGGGVDEDVRPRGCGVCVCLAFLYLPPTSG